MAISVESSMCTVYLVLAVGAATIVAAPVTAAAQPNQTTATLVSFPAPPGPGFYYSSSLLQAGDGNFYAVTNAIIPVTLGGSTTYTYTGTVFRIAPDGTRTTFATLPTIERSDNQLGFGPYSGLVQDAIGNFYGTTYVHGASPDKLGGMVYRLAPDGTLTPLHFFSGGSDGGKPHGNLMMATDGQLYGTTSAGGATGNGTIFSITIDGTFTNLYSFAGGVDGAKPLAALVQTSDGSVVGTTSAGGANGTGTVFRRIVDGTVTPLASISTPDASAAFSGLVLGNDGNFYGRTVNPLIGSGTIFKMTPDNTLITVATFANGTDDGFSGIDLVQARDGRLYGTTGKGGPSGTGSIFTIAAGGTLATLYSFSGLNSARNADGAAPVAPLIQASDGNLYGTTSKGGPDTTGTVFLIAPLTTLTTLYNFGDHVGDGTQPTGIVQGLDGNFYGVTTTSDAGLYLGTVFVASPGATPRTLHTFSGADGQLPNNGLIQAADGNFYGTTTAGGLSNFGVIYRIAPDGTFAVVHHFSRPDGLNPGGGVIQASDGNLYGTTVGQTDGGTLYQMSLDGTVFNKLWTFQGSAVLDGANPMGSLLQASDMLIYGTTSREGRFPQVGGTVFRFVGASESTVYAFDAGSEGPTPKTGVVEGADGQLWGTTFGQYQPSQIYRVTKDGVKATVHVFANEEGGNSAASLLLGRDGNFYGIIGPGGSTVAGAGIIYEVTPSGQFLILHRFTGPGDGTGAGPFYGALIEGNDGFLYGVTGGGGTNNKGTFFRFDRGR